MSLNPNEISEKPSKRGFIFLFPIAVLIISVLDTLIWWQGSFKAIVWFGLAVTFASCVLGLISAVSNYKASQLIKIAAGFYVFSTLALNIYFIARWPIEAPIWDRFCITFGLPLSGQSIDIFFLYGFHSTFSTFTSLLITISIPVVLLVTFVPQNKKHEVALKVQSAQQIEHTNNKGVKMTNTSNSAGQWLVKMPGQPDNAVDTPTLQMWARSGVIRPDTLIVEVSSNMSYQASQIPNVFSNKSYITALLLSFFLGAIGVDRFYLGHTGLGIGKLLTFGGCGVWAFIDFILIAIRKVTDAQGNPLA